MFQRIKDAIKVLLGTKPTQRYSVVEIKAPRLSQAWTKDTKDTVATLAAHPGFIALIDRLNVQKQALESKMTREYHKDLREVDGLQAGIFWMGYLQDILAKCTTQLSQVRPIVPFDEELEAFKMLDAQIERIGME